MTNYNILLSYNVVKDFAQNLKHPNILRVQQFCWGSFDWGKLCYSNKHFVTGWNEFCRPNSVRYPENMFGDIFGKYLFGPPSLILSLTDSCYWFIRQEMSASSAKMRSNADKTMTLRFRWSYIHTITSFSLMDFHEMSWTLSYFNMI